MNMSVIFKMALKEFNCTFTNAFVIIVCGIIILIALINGAGSFDDLNYVSAHDNLDAILIGFSTSWQSTSMICTIMAAFLGATAIQYDRSKNSLNVLLTKPLYRKDYFIGKFFGLVVFMLIFNTFVVLFTGLILIVFFRNPLSVSEFLLRIAAYIIVLTMSCSLVIALNMLFGVISKNILFVTTASMTYIYFDWIWNTGLLLNNISLGSLSILTPVNLYCRIIDPFATLSYPTLYDTLIPIEQWLSSAIPYIGLMFIEILVFLLISIHLFTRDDNV